MEETFIWKIGDLIKMKKTGKLGVVIKLHEKAGTPFYLVYDNLTKKQTWFPQSSVCEA
jgi:hypothetical protein